MFKAIVELLTQSALRLTATGLFSYSLEEVFHSICPS